MKRLKILSLVISFVMLFGLITASACSNGGSGEKITVTYHLNYDGAETRTVEIYSGTYAVSWKAAREGFKLKDWYTDEECKKEFDFSQRVNKNINLYAGWTVYEGRVPVTFNFNYPGCRSDVTVSIEKNSTVAEKYIPADATRLGHKQSGWYKDKECTEKWDFETDTVSGDTVLYAGFERNDNIPRDADGNIIFESVQVNVWLSGNGQDTGVYQKLAEQFNEEYKGKIVVNATTALLDQGTYSLRSQNTPEKSRNENTYYSVNDIYSLAGIELDYDDYYSGALQDSLYQGAMTSVPMFVNVPYLVYNKDLMEKYNGNKPLPSNLSEMTALIEAAVAGEKGDFKGMVITRDWCAKEGSLATAFLQCGAEYYGYKDGNYSCDWADPAVGKSALTALTTTYNLFSEYGKFCGANGGNDYAPSAPLNLVAQGKALFGVISWAGASWDVKNSLDKVGMIPLSNMFTDDDTEAAKRIPVNTFGLAFYKAKDITLTQLAAAAMFTEYCSTHSYEFTVNSWSPIRKVAYDTEKFDSYFKDLIVSMGKPENFYTYAGYINGKNIYSGVTAETYLIPMLNNENPDFKDIVTNMTAAISAEINN